MPFEGGNGGNLLAAALQTPCLSAAKRRPAVWERCEEDTRVAVWVRCEEDTSCHLAYHFLPSIDQLGAGTALPGLVAEKVGADVTLTDSSSNLEVLDNMRRTCGINKLNCKILGLTWGEWDVSLFSLKPKIVLGADVLYDSSDFDDLFATVTFLFQNTPGCVFITTYHNRRLLDAFSFMPSSKAAKLHGNIQLVEMLMNDEVPRVTPS
ncbi:hypothetical protein Taro_052360 [Colocasia esculenta]|uniref:Methyltransferase-like protein 23 n=1 Tax=Colocasia esculenta TaxID=4460 RepID=A0A843XK01_COLES|nr:hypothetical protein [Colocasia esculenta]